MPLSEPSATDLPAERPQPPAELSREVELPNGAFVTVRPIRPEDAGLERDFVQELSSESKYQRFLYALDELTPEMLEQFTCVDYARDMALVAVLELSTGERQIGVARYSSNPVNGSCDFAVVVADAWRGTGLARILMEGLIDAARSVHRLPVMEGVALADNRRMRGLARSLGFVTETDPRDPGLIRMRRTL